jgi:opacity protein-like surface antigen
VNNRGGWGGMLGIEGGNDLFSLRFVVEAGIVPTQFADPSHPGEHYTPLTWGGGLDGLVHLGDRHCNVYALVGVHVDKWETTVTYDSSDDSASSNSGHLGLRFGAGLNAGPFFVEARYRITAGDLRVPSDQGGHGSWSAVEIGAGLRFRM